MSRLTLAQKLENARSHGFVNDYDVARKLVIDGVPPVFVTYRPQSLGRAYVCAAWQVIDIRGRTDRGGHWQDRGNKTFLVYGREDRQSQLEVALKWATEYCGVTDWVKLTAGRYMNSYHPVSRVAAFNALIRQPKEQS